MSEVMRRAENISAAIFRSIDLQNMATKKIAETRTWIEPAHGDGPLPAARALA